jgi:2-polyprenyl-6-hydroxyphenyl methylase/3-demethylubiquinone-9 3-methyltransferase
MYTQSQNVEKQEIDKFSKLAEDWWNPFGMCKPLHDINPLRLAFIQKYTALDGLQVLDIGCGGGILTESLAKQGAVVTGIDLSEQVIQAAKQHANQQNLMINYQVAGVEDLVETSSQKFDVITCMELLEHVPNPNLIIQQSAELLTPTGHLFLSTLNRNPKAYLYAIVGAEYILKLLPKGTHHYDKFIKPNELFHMLKEANLQLDHMAGITYHPIFKTYKLNQDVSVNYLAHCSRIE